MGDSITSCYKNDNQSEPNRECSGIKIWHQWIKKDGEPFDKQTKVKTKDKSFNGKHKWICDGGGYGITTCEYCSEVIYTT